MKAMSLEEVAKMLRSMPPDERVRAVEALARAATDELSEGRGTAWTIVDPLECTVDMAAQCDYRGGPGEGRICLVLVDENVACPHADYIP